MSNSLQTFTNSCHESCNPKMEKIMNEFKEEFQPILDKYMNKFSRENIEYCSINGAFYEEFAFMLLTAHIQARLDLSKEGTVLE